MDIRKLALDAQAWGFINGMSMNPEIPEEYRKICKRLYAEYMEINGTSHITIKLMGD